MFPNSDPVMFMVAFYGCLLAELVPVPIEVPLTRKVTAVGQARTWAPFVPLFRCCVISALFTGVRGPWRRQASNRPPRTFQRAPLGLPADTAAPQPGRTVLASSRVSQKKS